MNRIIPILLLVLSTSTFAGDLSQLYEKAYFLETAKGDTEEALEIYRQIVSSDATDENQSIIIQSLERMLALHKRGRNKTLQKKVDQFELSPAIEDHVIATFGNPEAFLGSSKTYSKTNLPSMFSMSYPDDFSVAIMSGRIHELRFRQPNYAIDGIRIGTSMEEVLAEYPPKKVVPKNEPAAAMQTEKGTLYKNYTVEGTATYDTGTGIRFFFIKGNVVRLSLYDPDWPRSVNL
ncbi:MAG: hypothetical protein DRP64_08735 [Verrucomicrobia bacterium]|nr:MAG: hypothetical protein DRP64_08735 [Verrucomicrobiota bacterium]